MRMATENFDSLSVEFIYGKAQDYMNWLSVAPTGWKDSLGDYMDLDKVACIASTGSKESDVMVDPEDAFLGEGRSRRPVLRGDTIQWRNIDGPRSLMTAWKKLIGTSTFFHWESSDYLRSRA